MLTYLRDSTLDRRGNENNLADAFAYILRRLQGEKPSLAGEIIRRLSSCKVRLTDADVKDLVIETRPTLENRSEPDISIKSPRLLLHIEVKRHDSALKNLGTQLPKYLEDLTQNPRVKDRRVVLLAQRIPYLSLHVRSDPNFSSVRWYEVTDWLENGKCGLPPDIKFVLSEFIDFLKEKGLAMDTAGENMVAGAGQLMHFHKLVERVIEDQTPKYSADEVIHSIEKANINIKCQVEYQYDYPNELSFNAKISDDARVAKRLSACGWKQDEGEKDWMYRLLPLMECGSFKEPKTVESQTKVLKDFIDSCLSELAPKRRG